MRKAVLVLLALAALGAWAFWIWQNKRHERPANAASGTIECDEIHVASRYGGRVEKLFAREGDSLTNGQLIAELSAPELRAQHAEAAAMLADLEAGARKEELDAAKSEWESAVAELDLAQNEAKRALELFRDATISEIERDRAISRATASAPMLPPAPPRLSTTTGWPSALDIRSATRRPTMSALPPGANGTIRWIGRSG